MSEDQPQSSLYLQPSFEQITRFSNQAMSMVAELQMQGKVPALWHYSNGDGVIGILANKKLWATHVSFMNDTEEYVQALKMMLEQGDRILQHNRLTTEQRSVLVAMNVRLKQLMSSELSRNYVLCFTECEDDLAQWRGYSGTQNKFALKFDPIHLSYLAGQFAENPQKYFCYLARVTYDTQQKMDMVDRVLNYALQQFSSDLLESKPTNQDNYTTYWANNYLHYAVVIAPLFKHWSFRQEKEWRIVIQPLQYQEIRYRNRAGMVTPYLEMDMEKQVFLDPLPRRYPIREVMVGPSPHLTENLMATTQMVWQFGIETRVTRSPIPFRNL